MPVHDTDNNLKFPSLGTAKGECRNPTFPLFKDEKNDLLDDDFMSVLNVNTLLWKRDFAALQVVYNIVVCRFFIIIAHSVVDTGCHIAVDGQRKQADDAVAPSRGARIEGKNIITLLCESRGLRI